MVIIILHYLIQDMNIIYLNLTKEDAKEELLILDLYSYMKFLMNVE